jgi:hypothetical protein
MMNEQRLAAIRRLNLQQGLPLQAADDTIFNGALFDIATLQPGTILPPYHFTHPLSDYSAPDILDFIRGYGIETGRCNSPQTYSVGVLDIQGPQNQFITLITREINRDGFWCLVQRTIFLHKPEPFATVDFIAPSTVSAVLNAPAPSETWFRRPADLGPP